ELARAAAEREDVELAADEPVTVRGDADALARALDNLVQNARLHGRGRIRVSAAQVGASARLSVADEGDGLRAEERALAFRRFWRRSNDGRGSGLGLAIVRATAERHGGTVTVDGATFTIELPAIRDLSATSR